MTPSVNPGRPTLSRPAIPREQARRELAEVQAAVVEAGRLLHMGDLAAAKAAYDRLTELASGYERGASAYRKEIEDARLMSQTLAVRLVERETRQTSGAPEPETGGEQLFAAPMTVEQSERIGACPPQDSGETRDHTVLSPVERWELDRERMARLGAANTPAVDPAATGSTAVSPSSAPESAPITLLPGGPSQASAGGPLHLGPVSTEDRARAANDNCPVPDGNACVTMMRPGDLYTDAKTFQYKEAADDQGVSVKLQDVKEWDPDLAGVAYVWERADGRRFIVDGHQRLALAQRMRAQGQDPLLLVKFWREADGYTPRYMRLVAAKKNIAEDSGTAVDAARVLREEPNLFDTLSQSGAKVRDARGLAKLTPPVFDEAVEYINAGRLPENVAAVVSRVGENEEMQRGVLLELVRAQRDGHLTPDEAGQLVYVVRRSMLDQEAQKLQGAMPGFDVGAVRESAWRERDALTRGVLNAFNGTKFVLRAVERGETTLEDLGNVLAPEANAGELDAAQKSIAIIKALAESQGPLADYLDYQSRRVRESMDSSGMGRRRAVGPFLTQAVDYLRPFLETYLEDHGEALRADLKAKGFTAAAAMAPTGNDVTPAATGPEAPAPGAAARQPAVSAGEQANLGNDFATNAQVDMVMPSFDRGVTPERLTTPPSRPQRGQVHLIPEDPAGGPACDGPSAEAAPARPQRSEKPRRLEKPDPSTGSVKPERSRQESSQPEAPERPASQRTRPSRPANRRPVRPVPNVPPAGKVGRRVNPLSQHPLARLGRRKHGLT